MTFQALLVSKDEQATHLLTLALAGFGMAVHSCGYPDGVCQLAEQKFDCVLVDYDDPHSAALILQNAEQAAIKPVTVALLHDQSDVRGVFGAGANFVLYKPISELQAESTLRAATALARRERRRAFRVPVQLPVEIRTANGTDIEGILLDLSEDGLDVLSSQPLYRSAAITAVFCLPDQENSIELRGEVAWANPNRECGMRFIDLPSPTRQFLKTWVQANSPVLPPDEPEPVSQCKLTDLSLGACYVETESPFPEHSTISLQLRVADMQVDAEGSVRVMHPQFGMGVEFAAATEAQRKQVESFIEFLTSRPGTTPELLITPRALSSEAGTNQTHAAGSNPEDALLDLLNRGDSLSQAAFIEELQKQRNTSETVSN